MKTRIAIWVLLGVLAIFVTTNVSAQSTGTVERKTFYSPVLQTTKAYNIYLPPGYHQGSKSYPVVYFLRLHESEWFNTQLRPDGNTALNDVMDDLLQSGDVGEMILVGPNTGSDDGRVAGMVNMLRPELTDAPGIGTGLFEDYFVKDLIPHIDEQYRTLAEPAYRGVDGFSFGGYTALVLTFRNPGLFSSVGNYDGTFMWYDLNHPDLSNGMYDDPFWLDEQYDELVGPLFGIPRDVAYMLEHSAINLLLEADESRLDSLRSIRFHMHTGLSAVWTNKGRNTQLADSMAARGVMNSFPRLSLAIDAVHDYNFADVHASRSLVEHWKTFQGGVLVNNETVPRRVTAHLLPNFPNPFSESTSIRFELGNSEWIEVAIYSTMGTLVKTIYRGVEEAGNHTKTWDGKDQNGQDVASGIYFYTLSTENARYTGTLIRIR